MLPPLHRFPFLIRKVEYGPSCGVEIIPVLCFVKMCWKSFFRWNYGDKDKFMSVSHLSIYSITSTALVKIYLFLHTEKRKVSKR